MKLPSYIKPYPDYFKYLPISDQGFTLLIDKTIYLNKAIYVDLQRRHPQPLSIAVLKHQEIHTKDANIFKFLKFILFKNFRLKEEIIAFTEMFKYLKDNKQTFDLDRVAREFSGRRYIWMTSYKEGKEIITKIWRDA